MRDDHADVKGRRYLKREFYLGSLSAINALVRAPFLRRLGTLRQIAGYSVTRELVLPLIFLRNLVTVD